jgi:uncharacterized protein
MALEYYLTPPSQITIAGQPKDDTVREMLAAVGHYFLPTTTVLVNDPSNKLTHNLLPHVESYKPVNGRPTAYICKNFTCQAPYTDITEFSQAVSKIHEETHILVN